MDKELRKEVGKYFVDVSKLLFGGVVLSSILKIQGLSNFVVIIAGATAVIILALFGFYVLSIKDKNK